jgi:hypothetical protein
MDERKTDIQILVGASGSTSMWRSFSRGTIGSARLLNTLKPAMLHTFERWDLFDDELEG